MAKKLKLIQINESEYQGIHINRHTLEIFYSHERWDIDEGEQHYHIFLRSELK